MKISKLIILLELILVCFLGGCSQVSGLDEQLIVYGIGVDELDGVYEVTLQALNTQNTSESNSKENKKSTITVSAKAENLIDTFNRIEGQTGKKILYSHTIVLIIGEETAKNGINEIINFFSTNHKVRPTVKVLVSNVSAKEIFADETKEKSINSEDILAMTKASKENDHAIKSNIRHLMGDLNNELKAAKVWYLEYDKEKTVCEKIALFKSDKLTEILDKKAVEGLLLIYGKAKNISDSIKVNDDLIYYEVNKSKSGIYVEIKENKPVFYINLDVNLELYNAENFNSSNEIKLAVESNLAQLASNTIDLCIKKNNCDIFNFSKHIMNSDTNFFKTNLQQLENIIQMADYNVTVKAKIKYMGSNQKISSLVY